MAINNEILQDYTTEELIGVIIRRKECDQVGKFLKVEDCKFDEDELCNALEKEGYNVSQDEFFDIEDADDKDLKDELESRGYTVDNDEDEIDIVRRDFENNPTAALNVLQDLLGMQHTTSKEQVIEQLKNIL